MTDNLKEREAFEAWFGDQGKWPSAVERNGEGYKLAAAQSAWVTWQACCAAIDAALAARGAVPAGSGALSGKYGDVLTPFVTLMEAELHANSQKGDQPGWLTMSPSTGLLEIYWHTAKLSAAVKNNDIQAITEHSADVANMAMMLLDVCGGLAVAPQQVAQPVQAAEEISREDWIEAAMRVYLIAGDTEQEARECAKYQWGEMDMDDLCDPYEAAMSDIEGRGPEPQQVEQPSETEKLMDAAGLCRRCAAAKEPVAYTPGEWFDATTVDLMQAFYEHRLPAIREAAKEHGYAIGLHGSMRRDLDLIAAPWRDDASDADTLAHAIAMAACGITRNGAYDWEQKPAGRVATCIPICWTHRHGVLSDGHIDLSVAPVAQAKPEQAAQPTQAACEQTTKKALPMLSISDEQAEAIASEVYARNPVDGVDAAFKLDWELVRAGISHAKALSTDDSCPHGNAHIVHDCLRCGAPVCCGKCCADDAAYEPDAAGEIAYQLTKKLVIDMPTARAAVDAAISALKVAQPLTPAQRRELIDAAGDKTDGLNQDDFAEEIVLAVERHHRIAAPQKPKD